jgi:tRNA modification GTPase
MLVALLTPPGRGALSVIHVCGEGAKAAVERLFGRSVGRRPRHGRLVRDGEPVDEVVVRLAEGFTAEETVEITGHGGAVPVERVLAAFEALGARRVDAAGLLEHGVETGKLDRTRAEAWTLLPRARTLLAARMLRDQAEGALGRAVRAMESVRDAERLLATSPTGIALARPRTVVLAGAPNVGKSTLLNAFAGRDRALVSPEPGTTRDPVRETVSVDGVPVEMVDTAGVEEPRDGLERMAIERTRAALREADLVLFLFDAEAGASGSELRTLEALAGRRVILVLNKSDAGSKRPLLEALPVSAKTGEGLDELRRRILKALEVRASHADGAPVVFTPRQQSLLLAAATGRLPLEAAKEDLLR